MNVRKSAVRRPTRPVAANRRRTQADRSARTRSALLESAARGLSRHGYRALVLETVASEAGYTRGALYHQFSGKEELALGAIEWAFETWREELDFDRLVEEARDPVDSLIRLARGHAVFARRDVARLVMALRLELGGTRHPVGRRIEEIYEAIVEGCARLIRAGRRAGSIPPGPPAGVVALALVGAIEGATIQTAGRAPHDEWSATQIAVGVLGLEGYTSS